MTDTSKVWINRGVALKVLAKADSLDVYKQITNAQRKDIDTLIALYNNAYGIAGNLQKTVDNNAAIIKTMGEQRTIQEQQKQLAMDRVAELNKDLRKARRGKRWIALLAVVAAGGGFWLGSQ